MIKLVSKSGTGGLLPKGSYLTVENRETGSKFILRVDDTQQSEPFSPSPFVVEMDLSPLRQDQECQNIIHAYRVKDLSSRTDGLIDFIPPQTLARRSTQEEIDQAMGNSDKGPRVFIASIHSSQNQLIRDESGGAMIARLPEDMFYHQLLICGKTGSGKTVAMKYLAQYFVDVMHGAVLAINVKNVDLLKMDKPSVAVHPEILTEWAMLGEEPHGVDNYTIYYPATTKIGGSQGVTPEVCRRTSLNVQKIDPEALTGLLQGMSDVGAQVFPSVFRYWQMNVKKKPDEFTYGRFVDYFMAMSDDDRTFGTLSARGDESQITLHPGTCQNIARNLHSAIDFFDNDDAVFLDYDDILVPGKMSIIDVSGKGCTQFGSVLLRDLLHKIVAAKDNDLSKVRVLIIIDEVHQFYNTENTREALGDLDTICRTGRSKFIGVIFASQNPTDIPRGLESVINTKIFFKTDASSARSMGMKISEEEMASLKQGYAVASIHGLSQLRVLKFPLSLCGVFEEDAR